MQNRRRKRFMMAGKAPRSFTISPAVNGKTTWDLDLDGPLNLHVAGPGTYTLTPQFSFYAPAKMWGAGGAGGSVNKYGGAGGAITATVLFVQGVAYTIRVAASGVLADGGAPGGGSGQTSGYGGGGYTAIMMGATPILIAAGGGGGGAGSSTPGDGGGGGGLVGQAGSPTFAGYGVGGTQTAGGANGGGLLTGGPSISTGAGGGGGGYYGGGGGYTDGVSYRNGGGGGSSYANPAYTSNVNHYAAVGRTPGLSTDPDRGDLAGNPTNKNNQIPGRFLLS